LFGVSAKYRPWGGFGWAKSKRKKKKISIFLLKMGPRSDAQEKGVQGGHPNHPQVTDLETYI